MPEGDTVWLAGRRLHDALAGHVLLRSDFRVPALATVDLRGRHILEVLPRGKHLFTRIEGALTLHTHFRMDGSWHLYRPGDRWRGGPTWQVRVVLATADWQAVGYRLPVVELIATAEEDTVVGHLGPDLLGADWDPGHAVRRLSADPGREIGPALLDQRNLAGIGNLYKSEVLFLHGTSPWTPVSEVAELPALLERAHRLMMANRGRSEQVTTGDSRPGRSLWVYERTGRPCWRCGSRIRSADQGAADAQPRRSYWCPACQPGQPGSGPDRLAATGRLAATEPQPRPRIGRTRYRP